MASVNFKSGVQAKFDALTSYDEGTLYFITDTHRIYKGSTLVAGNVVFSTSEPAYASALSNVIYVVIQSDGNVQFYVKDESQGKMIPAGGVLQPGSITNIDLFSDDVLAKSSDAFTSGDTQIPTVGAVSGYVSSELENYDTSSEVDQKISNSITSKVYLFHYFADPSDPQIEEEVLNFKGVASETKDIVPILKLEDGSILSAQLITYEDHYDLVAIEEESHTSYVVRYTTASESVQFLSNGQYDSVVTDTSTNVATSSAVASYVASQLGTYCEDMLVDVSAARSAENDGTVLTFTNNKGQTKEITVADLFLTSASYDTATHNLSFTIKGQTDPVVVNLDALIPQAIDASQVPMSQEITVTTPVGNFTKGQKIAVTDLQDLLTQMLSQDSNPTATSPAVTITLKNGTSTTLSVEVGTTVTPTWSASLSGGSYTANGVSQAGGVTAESWSVTDTASHTSTESSGTFDSFVVTDSTSYKVIATATGTQGNMPKTYLGKDYPSIRFAKGATYSKVSSTISGYRKMFAGGSTATTTDSAAVRSLGTSAQASVKSSSSPWEFTAAQGSTKVIFAYPKSLTTKTPKFEIFTMAWGATSGFEASEVNVADSRGGSNGLTTYKVYTYTPAGPLAAETTKYRVYFS